MKLLLLPVAVLLLSASLQAQPPARPRIVVLGIAQDGGMPQTGCNCSNCSLARKDPSRARHVASLAIVVPQKAPKTDHVYLVDATPDLPAQIAKIHTFRAHPEGKVDRAPVDGVLLTHAHMGHYLGLAHFGFESLNTRDLPVWASPRMAEYLRTNGPWSQLVHLNNIALHEFEPGKPFDLEEGVSVKPIPVPHRDLCGTFLSDYSSRTEARTSRLPDLARVDRGTSQAATHGLGAPAGGRGPGARGEDRNAEILGTGFEPRLGQTPPSHRPVPRLRPGTGCHVATGAYPSGTTAARHLTEGACAPFQDGPEDGPTVGSRTGTPQDEEGSSSLRGVCKRLKQSGNREELQVAFETNHDGRTAQ